MISLVALSVDAMLPALAEIGRDLGVIRDNDRQYMVSALLLGLAVGQMIYGPLSDSVGRKPAIYLGLAIFIAGTLMSALAETYTVMLAGRLLQGFGAGGPRIVLIALVRDQYAGRGMARIMSMIMSVFILVPALAPAVGQSVLLIAHWRAIFGLLFGIAIVAVVWFGLRQPETLPLERRVPFSPRRIMRAAKETFTHKTAFGYSLAAGLIFGAFIGYLTSAQQIFQDLYGLGQLFPIYFGILALAIGGASLVNARLVMTYGMRLLCRWSLLLLSGLSLAYLAVVFVTGLTVQGNPPLWSFMVYLMPCFFCIGMLFGNFNALAMEPLGHIAGVAATVIASLATYTSLLIGAIIGASYDGTVLPLVGGFAVLGLGALLTMRWAER